MNSYSSNWNTTYQGLIVTDCQNFFRPSRLNRASVFEWHKRFKEGRESVRDNERCGSSKELFKSGQWHFHPDNAPVHNSIIVTDYLSKMGIETVPQPPYSRDLAPSDLWLFPKLRGCRYETIEEIKEAVTKVFDTLTQEDFNGVYQKLLRRLLRRRQEFHVCTINKSVHLKKKVWKLI